MPEKFHKKHSSASRSQYEHQKSYILDEQGRKRRARKTPPSINREPPQRKKEPELKLKIKYGSVFELNCPRKERNRRAIKSACYFAA